MSEWWTYRLDSFLLFSAHTYQRLVETYNAEAWPLQWLTLGAGFALLVWLEREQSVLRDRVVFVLLGAAWEWVAWGFLHDRFAAINWAAGYAAWVFAAQGAVLLWVGLVRGGIVFSRTAAPTDAIAIALIVVGLAVYPLLGAMLGRPWQQAPVFGLMPDPTVIVTLGFLLLADPMPRGLFVVPVLSCLLGGAMLWALHSVDAWVAPAAAIAAVACTVWRKKRLEQPA